MSFASGFAAGASAVQGGISSGLKMVEAADARKEKERLEQYLQDMQGIATAEATPQVQLTDQQIADLQQTNARMAEQGLAPAYNIQGNKVTDMAGRGLGAATFMGQELAPDANIDRLREQAYINRTMQYDPTQGLAMQRTYEKMGFDRAAEGRAVAAEEREVAEAEYLADQRALEKKQREGRNLLMKELATSGVNAERAMQIGSEYGLDPTEITNTLTSQFNIQEQDVSRRMKKIQRETADMSFEQLQDYHRNDPNISPGRHYIARDTKNGVEIVEMKTGETPEQDKELRTLYTFPSRLEAENSLRKLAYQPETAIESLVNEAASLRKSAAAAALEQAKLAVDKYKADVGADEGKRVQAAKSITELQKDYNFASMPLSEQERVINERVYAPLGMQYEATLPDPTKDKKDKTQATTPRSRGLDTIAATEKSIADKALQEELRAEDMAAVADEYTRRGITPQTIGNIQDQRIIDAIASDDLAPVGLRRAAQQRLYGNTSIAYPRM